MKRRLSWMWVGVTALVVAGRTEALGCSSCFGASNSPLAQGMNVGIFALLGVIGLVLAGVASVAVVIGVRSARRARLEAVEELGLSPDTDKDAGARLMREVVRTD